MNIREARLAQEWVDLQALERRCSSFRIVAVKGSPPEEYRFEYSCLGFVEEHRTGNQHLVSVFLPNDYPYKEPPFHFTSGIHHVNVHQSGLVCFGIYDAWHPAKFTLVSLVADLGEMISFRKYNPSSPACRGLPYWARWLRGKSGQIPLERQPFLPPDLGASITLNTTSRVAKGSADLGIVIKGLPEAPPRGRLRIVVKDSAG